MLRCAICAMWAYKMTNMISGLPCDTNFGIARSICPELMQLLHCWRSVRALQMYFLNVSHAQRKEKTSTSKTSVNSHVYACSFSRGFCFLSMDLKTFRNLHKLSGTRLHSAPSSERIPPWHSWATFPAKRSPHFFVLLCLARHFCAMSKTEFD